MTSTPDLPGLSVVAIEDHLHRELPGLVQGPLSATLLAGGRSNLTYLLTDGRHRWVLRRPPLGHVLETAHDMGREHRLLTALSPTDVPVPRPLLLGGADVIGAPFYVMEFAGGRVLREHDDLAGFDPAVADAVAADLVAVLSRLHALSPGEVGLADLGRSAGYLERQLARWRRQLDASHSRDLPELARLGERLGKQVPVSQAEAIVHGDYRLDNVVVDPSLGRAVAVLDWEMATLGDPLADLASTVVWWDGMSGLDVPVAAVPADVPGVAGQRWPPSRRTPLGADSTWARCLGTSASRSSRSRPSSRASTTARSRGSRWGRGSTGSVPLSRHWWSGGTRPCPIPARTRAWACAHAAGATG